MPTDEIRSHDESASSRFVFAAAIFLGAFLLFEVEFILGKFLLPWFGGTTGVWATSMLCFQLALLAGYAYAHWVQTRSRQATMHLAVVGIAIAFVALRMATVGVLPGASGKPAPDANPVLGIIFLFLITIGFPFAVLATTAPLLQAWYARVHRREPYMLYAVSNGGSLLALVAYPVLVERVLSMRVQAMVWGGSFFLFALFVIACSLRAKREGVAPVTTESVAVPMRTRLMWLGLSACPSALFLAVTNYLTQDVAPIPLLWALPLAIYLLSFIVVFGSARAYLRGLWHLSFAATSFLAVAGMFAGTDLAVGKQLIIFSAWLFSACMVCHGELVRLLPGEGALTSFYLTIATGGALGGVFVALVAPFLFSGLWELHVAAIAMALIASFALWSDPTSWLYRGEPWILPAGLGAAMLAPRVLRKLDFKLYPWMFHDAWLVVGLILLVVAAWMFFAHLGTERRRLPLLNEAAVGTVLLGLSMFLTWNARMQYGETVFRSRNFYGALTVGENEMNSNTRYFELAHGRITHGNQLATRASVRYNPTTYYSETSGAGIILRSHPQLKNGPLRVGAVGLGTGTLAAYARMGDVYRFYEINPTVIELAQSRPQPWFDYVPHARSLGAQVDIVQGDARLSLERELRDGQRGWYDVLLVDAFNGDSIPIHLLTVEAMQIYLQHLRNDDGVIALHISNRNVDLKSVAAGLAQRLELYATWIQAEDDDDLGLKSDWVLLSRSSRLLKIPQVHAAGHPLLKTSDLFFPPPPAPVWTDDFSNVLQVLELKDEDTSTR